jgi:hypothetical protein
MTAFFYRTFGAAFAHATDLRKLGYRVAISLPLPGIDRYRLRIVE